MSSLALHAYQWILCLCAFGLLISALEFWAIRPAFSTTGIYSGTLSQLRLSAPRSRWSARWRDRLFSERAVGGWVLFRLLCLGLAVLVPLGSLLFSSVMALLVLNLLAFNWRRQLGDDGSDQMNSIVLITLALCVGPHSTPRLLELGLWFIALQACLSYSTAGVAKLISSQWRSGEAVYRIFNTGTYGIRRVAEVLGRHKGLGLVLCWSVILMETLFPLCLLLPAPWSWVFLAWGVAFHLLNAVIMGLNSFFWAFVATYPALLFASTMTRSVLSG